MGAEAAAAAATATACHHTSLLLCSSQGHPCHAITSAEAQRACTLGFDWLKSCHSTIDSGRKWQNGCVCQFGCELLQVLVEVLSSKARAVGAAELLRESMKCAANAWALGVALGGLDDWTLSQIRPDAGQPEVRTRVSVSSQSVGCAARGRCTSSLQDAASTGVWGVIALCCVDVACPRLGRASSGTV